MHETHTEANVAVDILVLGAGMCGLTIAQELAHAGKQSWLLIDKGRSVGGRMATRRIDEQKFDHGAQFFTARNPNFKIAVDEWLRLGIVKEWSKGFNHHFHVHASHQPVGDGHPRYTGVGGMNSIAKHLAEKLGDDHVILKERVTSIEFRDNFFVARAESGREITAKDIVLTMPAPQSIELLRSIETGAHVEGIKAALAEIKYDACVALMGFFDPQELPLEALPIQSHNEVISFLADNHSKGLTSKKGALTIHLAPEASRGMFEAHDQVIVSYVCHQLKLLFGVKKISPPEIYEIQRWRYANPRTTLPSMFLQWAELGPTGPRLFLAGEAFGGPKIEGAWISGHATVQSLLHR